MIWLLALSFCIVATVFAADENSRSSYFKTVENRRLAAKVAKTFYSPSVLSCSLACLRNIWCSSTNFKTGTGGTGVCELIKHESNSTNHSKKIIHQPGNTYTIILKGCLMTGCLNGGSCLLDEKKKSFLCSCKLPWSGQRCEGNLNCPVGWSAYGDSCYYLSGTVAQNQTDARKACQTMNGDLPIIKSATEDKFVFELIRNSETVTTFGTWLGLERDKNKNKSFHWIDGTPLEGGFKNWFYKEPNNLGGNEDCVHMYGKQTGNSTRPGKWNDYPCSCYNSLHHCPVILCQKLAY